MFCQYKQGCNLFNINILDNIRHAPDNSRNSGLAINRHNNIHDSNQNGKYPMRSLQSGLYLLLSFFGVLTIVSVTTANSQQNSSTKPPQEIAANRRVEFKGETADEVKRRGEYFRLRRAGGEGKTIPDGWHEKAVAQKDRLQFKQNKIRSITSTPVWESVNQTGLNYGSGIYASGRLVSIAFDPTDPANVIYAAAANGGVWKTTDGGTTWNCMTNGLSTNASGAIAVDPNNPQTIYYATGEQHYSADSQYGDGIFKSTDGGVTWVKIASTNLGNYFSNVVIDPTNSNIVYVSGSSGTYKSSNAGASWYSLNTGTNVHSLIMNPSNSHSLYISLGSVSGANAIKKSTNSGASWTTITNGVSSTGRVEVAMAPSDTNTLYAGADQSGSTDAAAVYKTTDGGATWTLKASFGNNNYYLGGQGWYDNAITVKPNNPNTVIIGGLDVWRSTNGGTNFYDQTGYNTPPHPDVQVLVYQGSMLYAGTDGGIYRSTNDGSSWTPLNQRISSLQYVGIDYNPSNPSIIMGGTQDNGRTMTIDRGANVNEARGGDGGYLSIDPVAPNYVYGEFYDMSLERSNDGGYNWSSIYPNSGTGGLFYCPFEISPGAHTTLIYGLGDLWKTTSATTATQSAGWTKIASASVVSGNISAIGISATDANKIYIGTDGGRIKVTTDNGATWSTKTGFNYVSDFAVDQTDDNICYAVFGGFGQHVLKTTDGGTTWNNISGDLPNTPINAVVLRQTTPRMLIVGTDIGVFRSIDEGTSWTVFGNGLPSVPIYELKYKENAKLLLAGTHGRGAYYLDLHSFGLAFNEFKLDFGDVSSLSPENDSVVVTNGSASTLAITSVHSNNPSFASYPDTGSILPGGSMTFYVTCSPKTYGAISGSIIFENDGPSSPDSLPVEAYGLASGFSVIGAPVDHGNVRMDSPHADSFTVHNPGNTQLHLFSVAADTNVLQINPINDSIPSSGSKTFYYTFQPTATGNVTGHLIFTDDTPASSDTLTVSGRGAMATINVTVYHDKDLDVNTLGDDQLKSWHLAIYKDSIGLASLIAETVSASWSYNVLNDGLYIIAETDSGGLWIRANGNRTTNDTILVAPNTTVSDTFINRYYGVAFALVNRWNLVSVPVVRGNYTLSLLYPKATSSAYRFDSSGSYIPTTLIVPGKGYWVKFGAAHGDTLLGLEAADDTVIVAAGWNLIGSISTPLSKSDIIQNPPANINSMLFGYGTHGYEVSDFIQPGKGYWVNVNQSGTLELKKTSGFQSAAKTLSTLPERLNVITISDKEGNRQTLYFGKSAETATDNSFLLMPPPPPAGNFDARFTSNKIAEIQDPESGWNDAVINITSAVFPITVNWNVLQEGSGDYLLSDNFDGTVVSASLRAGEGNILIKDTKVKSLVLKNGVRAIPVEYALAQNYPNPFNPTTSIRYQLPVDSRVTLKIFNVVGQEIKTLVNSIQSAGYKSAQWNGTDNAMTSVPSGLYFYRIEATEIDNPDHHFTQVKKMMMMK
jgi:photosystem II stability/assembly factor-like uncharacterized protein